MRSVWIAVLFAILPAAGTLACGGGERPGKINWDVRFGYVIDQVLPNARLGVQDAAKVRKLRADVDALVAGNNPAGAFDAQREAMELLGYQLFEIPVEGTKCLDLYWGLKEGNGQPETRK